MIDNYLQEISREETERLANEEQFRELAMVLDRESKRSKLELSQLVLKSRSGQPSDGDELENLTSKPSDGTKPSRISSATGMWRP